MKDLMLKLYTKAQALREDHGQDLIEYALLAALLAVACIAAINPLATAIKGVFGAASTQLNTSAT